MGIYPFELHDKSGTKIYISAIKYKLFLLLLLLFYNLNILSFIYCYDFKNDNNAITIWGKIPAAVKILNTNV